MKKTLLASCMVAAICLVPARPRAYAAARPGVTVCGKVSLPDGYPAPRVTVNISGQNGFTSSTTTNDQGSYCFEGIPATIYSLTVTLPRDSKYVAEPVSQDTNRYGPTFTVNIFLRYPLESALRGEKTARVITAREAGQQVPKAAKKALAKAQRYKDQKKFEAALTELDKAIVLYPDYFQAFTEKGIVQIQSGFIPGALRDFEKAMEILPEYAPALSGAGYCLLTLGKYEQSADLLDRAVQLDATQAQPFMFFGIANLALGRWEKAQGALERALQLNANAAVAAHMYLADALAGQHLYGRAADELRTYLKLNPGAPNAEHLRNKETHWRSLESGVRPRQSLQRDISSV